MYYLHAYLQGYLAKTAAGESEPTADPSAADLLRRGIEEERKASSLYERIAASVKDQKVKKLFMDISNEEKVHAGEFTALLEKLDKDEKKSMLKGRSEAKDLLG